MSLDETFVVTFAGDVCATPLCPSCLVFCLTKSTKRRNKRSLSCKGDPPCSVPDPSLPPPSLVHPSEDESGSSTSASPRPRQDNGPTPGSEASVVNDVRTRHGTWSGFRPVGWGRECLEGHSSGDIRGSVFPRLTPRTLSERRPTSPAQCPPSSSFFPSLPPFLFSGSLRPLRLRSTGE